MFIVVHHDITKSITFQPTDRLYGLDVDAGAWDGHSRMGSLPLLRYCRRRGSNPHEV